MPIRADPGDADLRAILRDGQEWLGEADWFDAHTHMGASDPDGVTGTAEEILAGLDDAGHQRALLFAMQEPAGYPPANDAVFAACRASAGRLMALVRVDPNAPGAIEEARRGLDAGARGIKLHPRSDAFGLPHPVVDALVALAAERRAIVLFHAGRGIPALGAAAAALARAHPAAAIVLAHAGISDLGALRLEAEELPNLYFDTSWWQVGDLLALMTSVPPGRILYASDMPYGPGRTAAFLFMRTARAAGHAPEVVRVMAGGQLARLVVGRGRSISARARHRRPRGREPALERVVAHATAAVQVSFRGGDPVEALALARLACQTAGGEPAQALLQVADRALALAQEHAAAAPEDRLAPAPGALVAQALCGTPEAGVPTAAAV